MMDRINGLYVGMRERAIQWKKGQTMTEYALILSAVAVVVFVSYQTMGTKISNLLLGIDADL